MVLQDNTVEHNAGGEMNIEKRKRLLQTWGQWFRKAGWKLLTVLAEYHEDPEEEYPAMYEMYAHEEYEGDFDGYQGTVVYDEIESAEVADVADVVPSLPEPVKEEDA